MLFLPALSAACGLEAQEEIFPGNKFRYTELRLEGTLPVSGYPTPLYLSAGRRERRTDMFSTAVTLRSPTVRH